MERQISKASEELLIKYKSEKLFASKLTLDQSKHKKQLEDKLNSLIGEKQKLENDKIFSHSFEWRFEFPEVLNEKGLFDGFDVILGNPPYISAWEMFEG